MQTKAILGQREVDAILNAAQNEADANGWAVTISVADDGGHLLGLRRLDNAPPFTAIVSAEKAYAAALGRRETRLFEQMINNGRNAFLSASLPGLLEGGVPIIVDGQVIGAVGVSGVKAGEDAQVARAGITAVA
ncbi:heme-binding protein [Pistricoccus aurantiacus]|uniref:heme-binding protein n=1 Tax=Pistricoccus aurantiacus TaxID=1883414 RepID=UPI00362D861B